MIDNKADPGLMKDLESLDSEALKCWSFGLTSIQNDEIVKWFRKVPTLSSVPGLPELKEALSSNHQQQIAITRR